jgi:soluble lytic murein transglycosylase
VSTDLPLRSASQICDVVETVSRRAIIAVVISSVLLLAPPPIYASPDVPMCVAEQPYVSVAPINLIEWRIPMCGPFEAAPPLRAEPPKERAIEAYRRATKKITAVDYDQARLQLDLAHRGLARIRDRIALQSGRLELLRSRPVQAAEFFAEAEQSPHETVRVKASFGRVFSLLRADDPNGDAALADLLARYPEIPERTQLHFEHARSLLRQQRYSEALSAMRLLRVDYPSTRASDWAATETARLRSIGHDAPPLTAEERVRRARNLILTGPLDDAKTAIEELLESALTGELHAEVHYLAGNLARFEGRWRAAETYMRTAQLFPISDSTSARAIELRAIDMARTSAARDPEAAKRTLSELRAGRRDFAIPSRVLIDMIAVASAAGLSVEVDAMLKRVSGRAGVSAGVLFDAAMAGVGIGSDQVIAPILESIAKRPYSQYRAAALYHLARLHERSGRRNEAELLFAEARAAAQLDGDTYYALWALNGFERVYRGTRSNGQEGLANPVALDVPSAPRAELNALADTLQPVADTHASGYPWIARAVDLLRVGEPEAATEELFEAYLQWRQALGRPIARAGLACVATDDSRANPPIESEVLTARLELTEEERATLSTVAATLGDIGTAGAFAGPDFLDTLPRAYDWLAVPAAQRHGLDPNLLLAVMRVESAYQKHIVSYAGAVGLMQIMPRTGQLIAHALGHDDFTPAELLNPELNLEFAAWYLASLIRRFDGHLPLAIAAYNGGPHNVRRWIQESAEETPLDVLLERIPFTQTHRYVRKVLVHYQAYREQRNLPMPQLSVVLPEPRVDPLAF